MATRDNIRVVGASLIDASLIITFFVTLFSLLPSTILNSVQSNIDENLCIFLGFIIYRFITILVFDGTLGMKVLNLVFLNGDEEALTLKEKTLASIFILYQGVEYYKQS